MPVGKTELENAVFARAACVNAAVDGVNGALCSPGQDACLQRLIRVYNACFAAENRRIYGEASVCPARPDAQEKRCKETCVGCSYGAQQPVLTGLRRAFGVPVFPQDIQTEILLCRCEARCRKERLTGRDE